MKNNQKQPKMDIDALVAYEATHEVGALHREWAANAEKKGKSQNGSGPLGSRIFSSSSTHRPARSHKK